MNSKETLCMVAAVAALLGGGRLYAMTPSSPETACTEAAGFEVTLGRALVNTKGKTRKLGTKPWSPVPWQSGLELRGETIQELLDSCVLSAIVRFIHTAQDFIDNYGRCLIGQKGIVRLAPTPIRPGVRSIGISVQVFSWADKETVEAMNGPVVVPSEPGQVRVFVEALRFPPMRLHNKE